MKPGSPIQQDVTQEEVDQNITMEAVSVNSSSQKTEELESFLKKVDYDPYNEDEVLISYESQC